MDGRWICSPINTAEVLERNSAESSRLRDSSRMIVGIVLAFVVTSVAGRVTDLVNPVWATSGGRGFGGWGNQQRNPGAEVPFPMMRLGPDTTHVDALFGEVWSKLNRHGGYFYSDNQIRAFSHTHLHGAGEADYGNLGVMVTRTSNLRHDVGLKPRRFTPWAYTDVSAFRTRFEHTDEAASPGAYSVLLPDVGTSVQLAVSGTHAGVHTYTCGAGTGSQSGPAAPVTGPCVLVLDVCHRTHDNPCAAANVTLSGPGPLPDGSTGVTLTAAVNDIGDFVAVAGGVMLYFYATVSATFVNGTTLASFPANVSAAGLWSGFELVNPPAPGAATARNSSLGAYVTVADPNAGAKPVIDGPSNSIIFLVRVGVSTVSLAAAQANLFFEQTVGPNGTWLLPAEIASRASDTWETLLSAVQVQPPSDAAEGASDADALREGLAASSTGLPAVSGFRSSDDTLAGEAAESPNVLAASLLSTPVGMLTALQNGWLASAATGRTLTLEQAASLSESAWESAQALADAGVVIDAQAASTAMHRPVNDSAPGAIADTAIFYTLLYISLGAPSTYSDSSGTAAYLGFDNTTHSPPSPRRFVSDLSLWDIYRSQTPLLGLMAPAVVSDIAWSLVTMTQQGGRLPRWPFANRYTDTMEGSHGVLVISDCVAKGQCDVDVAAAYAVVKAAITTQDAEPAGSPYSAIGYYPFPAKRASVTTEFAIDDAGAALMAALPAINDLTSAALWGSRTLSFANTWDPLNVTLAPRLANGTIVMNKDLWSPYPKNSYYTEGDAAHWMWSAPQNMSALVALFPGATASERETVFAAYLQVVLANQTYWNDLLSTFLPNPYCWLGNEPSMLLPWSHAWAGPAHAWRAQFWPRWHLRTYYTPDQNLIPGNDDYGTLSAWGVWAYIGLYPVTAMGFYVLGSPVFANVTVSIPAGYDAARATVSPAALQLTVLAHNASAANIYFSAVAVNGVQLGPGAAFVEHSQLWPQTAPPFAPAVLEFWMTSERPTIQ